MVRARRIGLAGGAHCLRSLAGGGLSMRQVQYSQFPYPFVIIGIMTNRTDIGY